MRSNGSWISMVLCVLVLASLVVLSRREDSDRPTDRPAYRAVKDVPEIFRPAQQLAL